MNLIGRNFLTLKDFTPEEITYLLDLAADLKEKKKQGMYDGIEYRGFGQEIVEELAKYAGVPVWNGLTNEYHPTQMLADLLTIREHFGKLKGIKLVYMGDARYNMGNSLMIACAKMGMNFVACTTGKYFPNEELVETCKGYAKESGGRHGRHKGCRRDLYRRVGIHG